MKEPNNNWERRLTNRPPMKKGFTSDLERKVRERIRMKSTAGKSPFRAVAAFMSVVIMVGCGWWFREDLKSLIKQREPQDQLTALFNDPLGDKEINLKVQIIPYGDFDGQIKRPFIIRHPSVTLDTLGISMDQPLTLNKIEETLDKAKPDVLMLPMDMFIKLAEEGKLKSLDSLIKSSKFDLDALHQPLVNMLRIVGGGELYGLAPQFDSSVLFVNKDIFSQHHIPLPEEGMSLKEILGIAAKFQGTGTVGITSYSRDNPAFLATLLGESSGLQGLSINNGKIQATIQTDGWKSIWNIIAEGNKEGWISQSPPLDWSKGSMTLNQMYNSELFASGKAAMMLGDSSYYSNLIYYEQNQKKKMNWSTIPYQIDQMASNPDLYLRPAFVYAINADTKNSEAAWELLRFIGGPELGATYDQGGINQAKMILSRSAAMKSVPIEKWGAFYKMNPDPQQVIKALKEKTNTQYLKSYNLLFNQMAGTQMTAVIKGTKTVEQALKELQEKLDTSILEIKVEEEKKS